MYRNLLHSPVRAVAGELKPLGGMRHIISEPPGSEEWRRRFREIRNEFIATLDARIADYTVNRIRACDEEGAPYPWIWDPESYEYRGLEGTLTEAKAFLAAMIDEGMHVAFMGVLEANGIDIWLTTWEGSDDPPIWPETTTPVLEELHNGVSSKSSEIGR